MYIRFTHCITVFIWWPRKRNVQNLFFHQFLCIFENKVTLILNSSFTSWGNAYHAKLLYQYNNSNKSNYNEFVTENHSVLRVLYFASRHSNLICKQVTRQLIIEYANLLCHWACPYMNIENATIYPDYRLRCNLRSNSHTMMQWSFHLFILHYNAYLSV